MKTLILGGVRSGKSRLATELAMASTLPVTYIATARALDEEMQQRIARHRQDRPVHWRLIEEPLYLASAIAPLAASNQCILVDCLTLWLTNWLLADNQQQWIAEKEALLNLVASDPGRIILVSNETNSGVMPMGELTRRFCDEAGILHQQLATHCDQVVLTIAGLAQVLKGDPIDR